MIDIDDLSRNQLRFLCEELMGFVYMFRNSFISDTNNFENLDLKDPAVQEEYTALMECFYAASDAEDQVLKTGWLVNEVSREIAEERDSPDEEEIE